MFSVFLELFEMFMKNKKILLHYLNKSLFYTSESIYCLMYENTLHADNFPSLNTKSETELMTSQ